MNRSKRGAGRWAVVLLGLAGAAGWAALRGGERSDEALLLNRVWVDHLPSGGNDAVELFVAIDDDRMGAFQRASQYEGEWAIFRHEARGDSILRLTFLQQGATHDVRYHAKACDESGWDYCLTLEGAPRGVTQYRSRRGWEVDAEKGRSPAAALDAVRRSLP
jgi:hypothetical protein